jgi:tripartite-type tricarboxylate transporter receptor subunit TctC
MRAARLAVAPFAAAAIALTALTAFPSAAVAAESYPTRPVRFVVPFAPGGSTDTLARSIAIKMSDAMGQQVVVDNRSGGNGNIGMDIVAQAPPDGYTIVLGYIANLAIGPHLYAKLPFDPVKSFAPVTLLAESPNILVAHPSLPVKSVKELIAYAKANPGKLNFGSSGTGTLQHFAGELLNHQAGIKIVHIPYKGTAAVIPAMLAGEVQVGFGSLIGTRPQIQANRVRGLAITSRKRSPAVDLPTVAESGLPNYEVDQWYGVITSSKVSKPIVNKLSAAIAEALKDPEVVKRLASDGSTPVGSSPEQFNAHIRSEIAKWKKLVKEANLQLHQ